ncbi:MAG: hypothetical protein WCH57_05215 [Verrucomicrobiota bacterium]
MAWIESFCKAAAAWITRNEGRALAGLLAGYAALLFGVHGTIPIYLDNPGYTDPSINYLAGNGFTSTCWYAQRGDAFWAGNVPLHQFLLIPWLKLFGPHYVSVLWLNFLYVAAGSALIWRAMQRSGLVRTATWRLGAIAFFLSTDCAYLLLTTGRYDPLSFLLLGALAYLLTVQRAVGRLGGLAAVAALVPWAHLGAVLYTAVLGALLFLFYPRRFWKEVLCFGAGGAIGALALAAFYHHFGVWDAFLASVAPHARGSLAQGDPTWKREGLSSFDLPFLAGALLAFCIRGLLRRRAWRFPLFAIACVVAIPWAFLSRAVFPSDYGWFLFLPLVLFLFALFSAEPVFSRFSLPAVALLLVLGWMPPGNFLRRTVHHRLQMHRTGDPGPQIAAFSDKVLHAGDVAWISEAFYYDAKRRRLKIFTGPVVFPNPKEAPYPGEEEDLRAVTVFIREIAPWVPNRITELPDYWAPTGEELHTGGTAFVVYRRTGSPDTAALSHPSRSGGSATEGAK